MIRFPSSKSSPASSAYIDTRIDYVLFVADWVSEIPSYALSSVVLLCSTILGLYMYTALHLNASTRERDWRQMWHKVDRPDRAVCPELNDVHGTEVTPDCESTS